ncbi:restriction endonuclease [Clostridium butyricum]
MEVLEYLYTDNFNNFDEWFELVKNHGNVYPKFRIPYQEWLDEYINNIETKSENEVKELLRCLLFPYSRKIDESNYKACLQLFLDSKDSNMPKSIVDKYEPIIKSFKEVEMYRRIENGHNAWEGLTWILQLLPFKPYIAIMALNNYFDTEIGCMPDDRIIGIQQCIAIIEVKFIYTNKGTENYILKLKPREFELLIASLYENLKYEVEVTPATRDGGKDIIARINREDGKEVVYVECKLYKTTELKKETVRAFGYTILKDNINRGVLFCTGYVNEDLKNLDSRIQIWTLDEIIVLLNAHLGSNWNKRLRVFIKSKDDK